MTSVLSCLVATIALAADPGSKGLPFGIPPAPEDPVIARVAPPQCLFYVDWAGTASPSAGSSSETEKLLAEPEVQEFFNGMTRLLRRYLRKQDEEAKEAATTVRTLRTLCRPVRRYWRTAAEQPPASTAVRHDGRPPFAERASADRRLAPPPSP